MIEFSTGSTTAEVAKHHEQSEATPGGGQAQVRPSTVSRIIIFPWNQFHENSRENNFTEKLEY